jgi:aspartyl-tRNA(Asn)/glutamyl-tRNA(Gln) amidotransferase subunit C
MEDETNPGIVVNEQLIEDVAKVARLELTHAEIQKFLPQFKEILATFAQLSEVETPEDEVSLHAVELRNVMRDDVPSSCLSQDEALAQTKHKKEGYFKGPKVV